jgi:hypothetical protein
LRAEPRSISAAVGEGKQTAGSADAHHKPVIQ